MGKIEVPTGWSQISSEFKQQIAVFQRRRDGLVLSIEEATTNDKYAVSFLPQNFHQDNQVLQHLGNNGYLYSGDSEQKAFAEAKNWMEQNKK